MEKIWLREYPEGVVHEINPDAYPSLVEVFRDSCEQFRDKPAFTNMGTSITFRALEEKTRYFAGYLQTVLGLRKGDRFAIMLPNLLQYPVALFGALRAGLIVVNVNPLYTARELEYQLKDSGAETIVILANFAHVLEQVLSKTFVKHVIVTEIGDLLPFPKSCIVNCVVHFIKKMVPAWNIPQAISFPRTLAEGKLRAFTSVPVNGSDLAFLQYTGGTTGISKGAMLTHRNMVANIEQAFAWIKPTIQLGKEIIITALPLYHIFSLTANCLVFMKCGALNVLITNPKDIHGFVKELSKFRFTAITGVNTLFNALLNHPNFAKLDFSGLQLALGGGMAVQRAVAERWKKITGVVLLEAYGLTETAPAACINPLNLKEFNGSIGLPLASTEFAIMDENGKELPMGEAGELYIRGPQVMQGYWQSPEASRKAITSDGWLKTGDVGKADQKGYFYIVDRKKDMILVSGFNVYPNEIEDVLAHHSGVLEVAAIGIPDEHSGEVVKVFIVKRDPNLTEQAVMAYCRENLTGYKIPRVVEFRRELPKSNVGKILRRELRQGI